MHEDTFDTRKREHDLRQQQAEFERQRDMAKRAAEQQRERERRAAEQAEAEKHAIDAASAAARLADEERQRRKLAAKAAVEQAAAEHRRVLAEAERRREEERRQREAERLRREGAHHQRIRGAWERYEERWRNANAQQNDNLTFASIPWPMELQPRSAADISSEAIKSFVLSPLHSASKLPKQRLREQLLRFHPDRFEGRWLGRVRESDREEVRKAINDVARYLNEALSQCHSPLYVVSF